MLVGADASSACICVRVDASMSAVGLGTNARSFARPSPSMSLRTMGVNGVPDWNRVNMVNTPTLGTVVLAWNTKA